MTRLPEAVRTHVTEVVAVLLGATATALALLPARAESNVPPPAPQFDLERPEIKSFLDDVAERHSLSRPQLVKLLETAQPQPRIVELISKPAERVIPWVPTRSWTDSGGCPPGGGQCTIPFIRPIPHPNRFWIWIMTSLRVKMGMRLWASARWGCDRCRAQPCMSTPRNSGSLSWK